MSKPETLMREPPADAGAVPPTGDGPAAPKRPRRKPVLAVLAVLALGGASYAGWGYWTHGRFVEHTDDAYVQADIAMISSRVQGYVKSLPVEENAHVHAGDVLVRLEDDDYRIALATAESRAATADRTLARIDAQIAAARAAVVQAEADRDAAEAQLRTATNALERVKGLAARNFAAVAQLDTATEDHDTARATLAKTTAAVASARAEVNVLIAQRAEAEGDKHQLELAVDQARRDLDRTVLRAPTDGTLANLGLEPGDLVTAGTRLAALVPDDALYVEANFKETQMQGIAPGATVEVTLDALPGRRFEGKVTSAAPATGAVFSLLPAENATGNFTKVVQRVPVRIQLPPEALATGQLRAGLSAVVSVDTRTGDAAASRLASVH
ncbi:HlyD family secretion protein [Rhodovulum visakhapatnamense]|uniref:HlyD family secretion protein n=2 Tax=Rhodovulum visakhapatnamense TaxID=364297 RepID=A0ABS1RCZ0_9RHOB|nr:HlyD family secretion protein [Rhodovulum visakhapatnamense]MBL3577506.1 HlyD family secretion protein [Rhodovulum visakhapatnamense]